MAETAASGLAPAAPRVLFVPVSGPFGMGEYARSLAIARGVATRRPSASIHFLLSRAAPYAAATPFAHTLLPASPTFHTALVARCLREFHPDLVIFDNAGRTAQLRAAREVGARVAFISARRRQRAKAFRWSWMRLIDEHWIAYPEFTVGAPSAVETFKLRWLGRPRLRYLDVIFSAPDAAARAALAAKCAWEAGSYVLVVPGGGTGHPRAGDAMARFHAAARRLSAQGNRVIFVGPTGGDAGSDALIVHRSLPQAELALLMQGAVLVIANGGSTLLQAIACGAPCLAIPIAADQPERIRRCVSAGVAVEAPLDTDAIAVAAAALLTDGSARVEMTRRAAALGLADGIDVALQGIESMLTSSSPAAASPGATA